MSIPNKKTFPFTKDHLTHFREELDQAGSFHLLMQKKKGLKRKRGMKFISLEYDIEKYKKKFLVGVYESLRPFYDTDMPYIFWSALYENLLNSEPENV